MALVLQNAGPVTILNSSSSGYGEWYRVHPKMRKLTFQALHESIGAGAGTTVQSTIYIQGSNDGTNALGTTAGTTLSNLGTIVLNGGSPQSDGFAIDASWAYIRAGLNSGPSTGRVSVRVAGGM